MKHVNIKWIAAALVCGAGLFQPNNAWGMEVYLRAAAFEKTLPGGRSVQMWGFAQEDAFGQNSGTVSSPGPVITVDSSDSTLNIHLDNNLAVPISIVIPGQLGLAVTGHTRFDDSAGRSRASSFVQETPPKNTEAVTYTWTNLKPGTYLYHSGSHAALQVQMGLYGAVTKNASNTDAYPGIAPASQQVLLFSEIDADLHDAVKAGTYGVGLIKSTIHSRPQYFLINGEAYPGTTPIAASAGQSILLRLLNAGYDQRVPVVHNHYLTVVAEDGFKYNHPRQLAAPPLPALKTLDVLLTPDAAGELALYDRALGLVNHTAAGGGMLVKINVTAP